MILPDVNILVYAHNERAEDHLKFMHWLLDLAEGHEPFGMSDLVLSSFIRITTNPSIFTPPTLIENAIAFTERIRSRLNCVVVNPGPRHWDIFTDLCRKGSARGNLVPDAYLAALAIESGSEWITTDRDYARFPGLRWRHPFD
jgi:toxin-antitoxin system PIN domain toxin